MTQTNKNWSPSEIKDIVRFSMFWFGFRPHQYQEKFLQLCLSYKRVLAIWSRQSGKSTCVAIYTLFKAITCPGIVIIMIAPNQRQSKELYTKVRNMAMANPNISSIINKSTETELTFNTRSRIISLPCGPDGSGVKGFTGDIVIIEEAGKFKDSIVNSVVIPMLASKKDEGQIIKIGTPLTRNHFYDSCYKTEMGYNVIKISWKECVNAGQYSQSFIDEQKRNLTDIEFKTEYEAEFVDEASMFFPMELLENSMEEYNLFDIL